MLIGERYRLLSLVGQGGMGRVWLARDELLDRDVAIKEINPPVWLDDLELEELAARTIREARIAARLNHPNLVSVHDVVRHEGNPWIVMEYVPSRSLQDLLRTGPVDPRRAAEIGLAVLSALTAAHRAGVVHRDVKPGNVLIADDGRIMLTDFGLATVDDGTDGLTRSGMILGSPEYVAPERAAEGVSTVATDLWSLGATLHAAVEGRSPYARSTAMATLTALATAPPDPAPHAGPLGPVLSGLLQRDPGRRLSGAELERLLREASAGAAAHGPSGEPPGAAVTPGPPAVPRWADLGGPTTADDQRPEHSAGTGAIELHPARRRPGSARHRHEDDRSRWRSWVPLVAAALAVLASMGTALIVMLDRQRSDPETGRSSPAGQVDEPGGPGGPGPDRPGPPGGRDVPAPPFACVRPGHSGRAVVAASPPAGETLAPPAGWTWHSDDSGFRVIVPIGWRYFRDTGASCFQDPRSSRVLGVEEAAPLTGDPVDRLREAEQRALSGGTLPDYQRIRLGTSDQPPGAEWELRWTAPYGERIRAVRTLTGTSGKRAYVVTWLGPDQGWTGTEAAAVRAGFRPPA